jgi:beta-lactam-binding protein with PASTA domain
MASRRELPADVAAALDRVPEARDRFAALPGDRQLEWLSWVDRGRGGRARAARIDELVRGLLPSAAVAEEETVARPAGPPPNRYWWLWLLLLLVLVLGGLLAWYLLSRGDDKTTVPNVIGLREEAAAERIRDRDLDSVPRTGRSDRPQGVVFAQEPGAGTQLGNGQTVTISISAGRQGVPDVTGLPLKDARQRLDQGGFDSDVKRVASSRPKDIVVEQSPVAGVTAVAGTHVVLSVSSGAKPVIVPSVLGQTQGAAVSALTRLGLKPLLQNVPSSKPVGVVVAQKPPADEGVEKGSQVTLNVSTGSGSGSTTVSTSTSPGTTATTSTTPTTTTRTTTTAATGVRVPQVSGLFQATALRRLNVLGLRPTVAYVPSSQQANRVVSQIPSAGRTLQKGARVRVNVSTGPDPQPPSAVPSVTGQEQASAASALRSAGFRVVVLNRPTSKASEDGLVVEQQPEAGTNIPSDAAVTIFIGRFSG